MPKLVFIYRKNGKIRMWVLRLNKIPMRFIKKLLSYAVLRFSILLCVKAYDIVFQVVTGITSTFLS